MSILDFLNMIIDIPILFYILLAILILFLIILFGFVVFLIIGFIQGREISLWPPKIGTKPENTKTKPDSKSEKDDKSKRALLIVDNDLGDGIKLGGTYMGKSLRTAASDWARYDNGWVRSGWLFTENPYGLSHAVTFFKIHKGDGGNGVIYLLSPSQPEHEIWFETNVQQKKVKGFTKGSSQDWQFQWK
jgi:hypothetical protein